MFNDDRVKLNEEGLGAIGIACKRMQELLDRGYTAAKQLTEGRLILLEQSMEEMGERQPTVTHRSPVPINIMFDFLGAIGYSSHPGQRSEYHFEYDTAAGAIPLARMERKGFVMHIPHSTWGNKFERPALDMVKKRLATFGVTYELIAEFYQL